MSIEWIKKKTSVLIIDYKSQQKYWDENKSVQVLITLFMKVSNNFSLIPLSKRLLLCLISKSKSKMFIACNNMYRMYVTPRISVKFYFTHFMFTYDSFFLFHFPKRKKNNCAIRKLFEYNLKTKKKCTPHLARQY